MSSATSNECDFNPLSYFHLRLVIVLIINERATPPRSMVMIIGETCNYNPPARMLPQMEPKQPNAYAWRRAGSGIRDIGTIHRNNDRLWKTSQEW